MRVAYDTETTGLDVHHGASMFAFATCDEKGETEIHRLTDGPIRKRTASFETLKKLWTDPTVEKVMHNAKFDIQMTNKMLSARPQGKLHCTHKMSHILQNTHKSHALDDLAWELAEYPTEQDKEVSRVQSDVGGYQFVPIDIMSRYQKADVERTMLLFQFFAPKIQADPKMADVYETEMELINTTIDMENRGVMLNISATKDLIYLLGNEAEDALTQLRMLTNMPDLNPNATEQVREALFKRAGLPPMRLTEKTGKESTRKDVLLELLKETNSPLVRLLIKIRSFTKGVTYLRQYLEFADANGILHPSINTCGAVTGRESCSKPNLQNVSKTEALLNLFPVPARRCFRPRPGYINIHVDYAGIEMRLLVHYSKEPAMVECLLHGDGDVHSLSAFEFFQERFKYADKDKRKLLRTVSKHGAFCKAYGGSASKLATTLGVTVADGLNADARFRMAFPRFADLTASVKKQVYQNGCVETIFGRKLYIPKDQAYIGTNHMIQCTAAHMLKVAQNRVHQYNKTQTGGEVNLLLPIHDELVIEYPANRIRHLMGYMRDIRKLMIDFPQFEVPFEIEADYTTVSWEKKTRLNIHV